ncbi:MAG: hypothetical protein ABI772_10860 [Bacteroidota bacterium]
MKRLPVRLLLLAVLYIISMTVISCKHGCHGKTGTSSAGSRESHNMGLNCMNCHTAGGDGEGCFNIGGTAYSDDLKTTFPGCVIDLYTEAGAKGELVTSLVSDGKGNFYTGRAVNWGKGLYPTITSPAGNSENMLEPITNGGCNKCHGSTTDRIFIY